MSITASEARQRLFPLLEQVNNDQTGVEIVSKGGRLTSYPRTSITHCRRPCTCCAPPPTRGGCAPASTMRRLAKPMSTNCSTPTQTAT